MRNREYHNIKAIYNREMLTTFSSPMALIFFFVFAVTCGYFFTSPFFLVGQSELRGLFSIIPLLYLILVPAITMNMVSRDWNLGTMEIMTTLPITDYEYIIGKFMASVMLVITSLFFTVVHVITVYRFGTEIDTGAIICGYFGLILLGAFYSSVGIFASSLFDNNVQALMLSFGIVLIFFMMDKVLIFVPSALLSSIMQYMSVDFHLSNISRGVIDTRNIIYFISMSALFLNLSVRALESRQWR
jgi:ABC-2 type transport system permease protein|tara:strand:- start:9186 stop:9917 length:732 start_codon:yes stop_codon:yes gene_type:complete